MSNIKEQLYETFEQLQQAILKTEQEYAREIVETALLTINKTINPDSFEFRVDEDGLVIAERVDGYGPCGRGIIDAVTVNIQEKIKVTISYWGDGEPDEEETFYI